MALVLEASKSAERDTPDYLEVAEGKMTAKLLRTPKLADVPYRRADGAAPDRRILLALNLPSPGDTARPGPPTSKSPPALAGFFMPETFRHILKSGRHVAGTSRALHGGGLVPRPVLPRSRAPDTGGIAKVS